MRCVICVAFKLILAAEATICSRFHNEQTVRDTLCSMHYWARDGITITTYFGLHSAYCISRPGAEVVVAVVEVFSPLLGMSNLPTHFKLVQRQPAKRNFAIPAWTMHYALCL